MIEWRDVVGYEGIYEVSNTGEVRTHKDKTTYSARHGIRHWEQRVLKQKLSKADDLRVTLYKDKRPKTWLVHRLVALAFLPKIVGKDYINHIDGSRLNNHVSNLEWCNHKENNNHAFDNGLIDTGHKIMLFDNGTNQKHQFRSKTKASEFLGKHHGFISALLRRGENQFQDFTIKEVK